MKKTRIDIQLIIIILLLSGVILVFYTNKKKFSWYEEYKFDSKDPYNLYILPKIIDDYFPNKKLKVIHKRLKLELSGDTTKKGLYIFIGNSFYLRSHDVPELLKFVSLGNQAFISAESLPDELLDSISNEYDKETSLNSIQKSTIEVNFNHSNLYYKKSIDFTYFQGPKPYPKNWVYMDLVKFRPKSYLMLGYFVHNNNSYINFIKIPYKKGFIYLHSTPILFTNFFIKESKGYDYCSRVFSNFSAADIYFDSGEYFSDKKQNSEFNPLSFILKQRPLLWAWYILLSTILIYILVYMKKKQRTIPVMNPLINTSISFVEHVGKLYYLHDSVKNIANLKMKLFLFYIRQKFKIDASKINSDVYQSISLRSGISFDETKNIFDLYDFIQTNPNKDNLKEFHQAIINFYKKLKNYG